MQFQILVQHKPNDRFIASVLEVPDCVAEAATEEEAIAEVQSALSAKPAAGKVVTVEVDVQQEYRGPNPLLKHCGALANDPTFDDWQEKITEFRLQADRDEAERQAAF